MKRFRNSVRGLTLVASFAIMAWGLGGCVANAQDPESDDGATETAESSLQSSTPATAGTADTSADDQANGETEKGNVSAGDDCAEPEPAPWIPGTDDGESSRKPNGGQPHMIVPTRSSGKY